MQEISSVEILQRLRSENPWWDDSRSIRDVYLGMKKRAYFNLFFPLIRNRSVRRAVVLMGPRRVGKTVMIHHAIQALIDDGIPPEAIVYFSVDHPIYTGLSLEKFLEHYGQSSGVNYRIDEVFVFYDEIQYLKNWEVHLKSAVDSYPNIKFVVSGSAAAALRLKSQESGAGRFTDFLLPPLTFYEYIDLLNKTNLVHTPDVDNLTGSKYFTTPNIELLNKEFINYLNFGGYPEVIFAPEIQADPGRFIKSDIIDKVLLRDLPSLYGISDIQELNHLFTTLAFNTANEISLQELAMNSGVAKNTIKRYIDYLEAAFLIKIVHRVDQSAKKFTRANFFKVYLTNPTMRAALFLPIKPEDEAMGRLAETAIFSQWFHSAVPLHYARWDKGSEKGEVDLVHLGAARQNVAWAVEVKWSDRFPERPHELAGAIGFCRKNNLSKIMVTSKTTTSTLQEHGVVIEFEPASLYCYTVGHNLITTKRVRNSELNTDSAESEL
ncbi:MAG TPA: ATP-binding protein [Candidatus Saccharimonadales bacterium]|nr:ATP-binding protein [Candidatus Saccharimonadales bacterium]